MAREVDPRVIRRLDLSSFTGDAWATQATLALPTGVPLLRKVGHDPLRLVCEGRTAKVGGAHVGDDAHTSFDVGVVVFRLIDGQHVPTRLQPATCTNGDVLNLELLEDDLVEGDLFAIGVTDVSTGPSSADWLRVYPTSAVSVEPTPVGWS